MGLGAFDPRASKHSVNPKGVLKTPPRGYRVNTKTEQRHCAYKNKTLPTNKTFQMPPKTRKIFQNNELTKIQTKKFKQSTYYISLYLNQTNKGSLLPSTLKVGNAK